jgi:hypothetical protein
MTNPTRVAAVLTAAVVAGLIFCARFDPAIAQRVSSAAAPAAAASGAIKPRGRAYLFRGFAGMVFSRGTDELAEKIEQAGFTATVNEAVMCPKIGKEAIADYRRDPAMIILIGHSVGGACVVSLAEVLQAEDIPVALAVSTEPARITHDVPTNVERFINIFQSNSILGGVEAVPAPGFQGHYASFDLVEHKKISHVNMEKTGSIQDQVLNKILQLAATPAKTESEAVPIHYVVPADAAIELWDSGMPVIARSGDTLQTLAALYRVPLWSLAQINQVPDDALLVAGQRVIIPRHLLPPAAPDKVSASGKKSSRR